MTFHRILGIVILVSMVLLATVINVLVGHRMAVQWRNDLLSDGQHVAQQLAKDSRIALIQQAPENVQSALDMACTFPNVKVATIYTRDGEHFTGSVPYRLQPNTLQKLKFVDRAGQILNEDRYQLSIAAPVTISGYRDNAPLVGDFYEHGDPPMTAEQTQLGVVVLTMSKQAMHRAVTTLKQQLLVVIALVAGTACLVVMGLVTWITAPIKRLARVMTNPRTLETYTRVPVEGIRESRDIARAFNTLITSFADVKAELIQSNSCLESRVQERTKALTEANEAKSRFLSMISHEIRTPLHGITASTDLLLKTQRLDAQPFHYVQTIHHSAHLLLDLMNAVLDLSRLDVGTVKLQVSDFDLHRLLHTLMIALQFQADAKGLAFNLHVHPDTPYMLRGDHIRLSQILTNLTANAIKFTERGSVKIYVSAIENSQDQATLHVEVVDTGIGIAPAMQSQIFDDFIQGDSPTVRRYGGAGLGTAIARGLVERMGGQIGVRSNRDGSCFWFNVPFPKQGTGKLDKSQQVIRGLRVLVIAANQPEHFAWRRLLQRWGIPTRMTRRFNEADNLLHRAAKIHRPFTTVLIDDAIALPTAQAFAKQLLKNAPDLTMSLILIGAVPAAEPGCLFNAGYTAVLNKPLDKEQLYGTLRATREVVHNIDTTPLLKHTRHPLRILVAEDNATNQFVLRNMLQEAGYQPHIVDDGEQALAVLENEVFDLAIIDMHMPRVAGHDVVMRYRQHHAGSALPIIMLTADATHSAAQAAQAAGVTMYLTKPVTLNALCQAIATCHATLPMATSVARQPPSTTTTPNAPLTSADGALLESKRLMQLQEQVKSKAIVDQFVTTYIQDAQNYLTVIEDASTRQAWQLLRETAHALKGASAAIGSTKVMALCDELRQLTTEDTQSKAQIERLAHSVSSLRSVVSQVVIALQPYRQAS